MFLKELMQVRNLFIVFILILSLSLIATDSASAYSYAEKEDPMAILFKSAVSAAKKGDWPKVSEYARKGMAEQKGHIFEADFLSPAFKAAVDAKDVSATAEVFANLVYISIREKLHRTVREAFKNFKSSRARLQIARKSYLDVLDGNVKKQDPERSGAILKQFDIALKSLGNPGFFGVGKKQPDKSRYSEAVKTIETLIIQTFPSFK